MFLIAFFINPIYSQSIKFEHLDATDGLSHNKVQCILQDKQGYIWFGTIYGLNRYDGYSFKAFENIPGDSLSIGNNNTISLYQDKSGIIWIGTSTIISAYNPQTETFTNYNLPGLKGWIHDFFEDEKGLLWMAAGGGLFSLDPVTHKATYHITDSAGRENIQGVIQDEKNKDILWLSSETGIRKYNKSTGTIKLYAIPYPAFEDISREITHTVIKDTQGNIWMSTSGKGIYMLNVKNEKLTRYILNAPYTSLSHESALATQIIEGEDGIIWIGSEGICFLNLHSNSLSFDKMDMEDNQGFPVKVRALLKDKNGIFWIGTERGIAKYDPKLYSFTTIKPDYPFTLQSANTILEDEQHTCWVGNYVGLGIVNPQTGIYQEHNSLLNINAAIYSSSHGKDGSMWFGSESCLYHIYKNKSGGNLHSEKISIPVNSKIQVRAIAFDTENRLWIGTRGAGLFSYDLALKNFTSYKDSIHTGIFSPGNISVLCPVSADSLLIGTKGDGLILMRSSTGKFEKIKFEKKQNALGTGNTVINAIYEDDAKNIWIGTESNGLWRTNITLSSFTNYGAKDGLQSMDITQITGDRQGQLWLNTSLGLEVIDPARNRFVHYSARDGLSINEPGYLFKKSSGDLLRIDFNGIHIFHPSSINLNKEAPPVYINSMQVLDKVIPIYKDTVIQLNYEENYLSFSYVALNYTQSFKNRYAFMLEGLNKKWIDAGDRRFATYANIEPGTYTFHVKASNNNGIWNETGAKVTFIIAPPWWRTWWFYTLCVLLIAGIIYTLFKVRLRQELKAVQMRDAISRDLHDEVGSTLSSIGFLSSMALNDADSSNTKVFGTLTNINESSTRMLDAMNDIIWNIQPKNDSVENILARMISFASEILESRKINLHISIADNISHLHLGLTARHDFYLIFKEAVNNLAKYSAAADAWVNLEFKYPYLFLSIRDNGKGFDPGKIKHGNGLKNMQSRAEKIDAIYHLETTPGQGTVITLKVKPG